MNKIQKGLTILTLVFFFVCFAAVTTAAEEGAESNPGFFPVADVTVGPHGLTFQPKVEYGTLVLTVSKPDGRVESHSFASGITPYLELAGDMIDGSYTYELRVIPVSVKRERLSTVESDGAFTPEGETQTGYFFVKGGKIVTAAAVDGIARPADIIHADDVIIQYSLCVGNDCVNGENFGFDTLRLKENNLRIHFDDTSTSASFPKNDWRITINDSANGGASYFGVDDATAGRRVFTLEAGAPANSLYVDDGGRLGLGTSTPVVEAHIKDGDTPTLRLEQDGSSGFTPQTWDVAGNEANFFIRDVTNGSKLSFKIKPGAPTSSLFIAADGDIGLGGNESPAYPLHMKDADGATAVFEDTTNGTQAQISAGDNFVFIGAKTNHDFRLTVNDSPVMTLETDGDVGIGENNPSYPLEVGTANGAHVTTGGAWTNGSSREYKENIVALSADEAVEALEELTPVKFEYKNEKGEKYVGFIAEDVPELVAQNDRKSMSAMDVVAVLAKVVKEQQKTIAELKKEISELKKR